MGEASRRRKLAAETADQGGKQEGVPSSLVPRFRLPIALEKDYGRPLMDVFRRIDDLVYEYDSLIVEEKLSVEDVFAYLGFLDINTELQAAVESVQKWYQAGCDADRKAGRPGSHFHDILTNNKTMNFHNRPLAYGFLDAVLTKSRFTILLEDVNRIEASGAGRGVEPEILLITALLQRKRKASLPLNEAFYDPEIAREMQEALLLLLSRVLKQNVDAGHITNPSPDEAEAATLEGDQIAKSLQGLRLESCGVTAHNLGLFESVHITRIHNLPPQYIAMLDAKTSATYYTTKPVDRAHIGSVFALSTLSGDLTASQALFVDPVTVFQAYGMERVYALLRLKMLRQVESAVFNGQLPLKSTPLQEALSVSSSSTEFDDADILIDESDFELVAEMPISSTEEVPQSQPLEEVGPESEMPLRERRAKAERIRTIKYRKAFQALKRLGVTFETGGPHLKARYNGIPAAFPNSHSGKNGDITYILRSVLEILGISEEDFIRKL